MFEYGCFEVFWDGEASLRIRDNEFTVAVDPGDDSPLFEAGIVLVTGRDVFDFQALKQVCGRGTCVVLPDSLRDLTVPCPDVEYVEAGETVDIFNVEIEAFKGTGNGLAYRFDMQGTSFYASGDSGFQQELIDLENRVDVSFLRYDDEEQDVVRSAVRIKPNIVVPYMYEEDSRSSAGNLKADLEDRNITCKLMK